MRALLESFGLKQAQKRVLVSCACMLFCTQQAFALAAQSQLAQGTKPKDKSNGSTNQNQTPNPNWKPQTPQPDLSPAKGFQTETPAQLVSPLTPVDLKAKANIDEITSESTKYGGAVFVDPEKVVVKPPLLSALIILNRNLSPYQLDATTSAAITLRGAIETALRNNLDLKVAQSDVVTKKWNYISTLGNFLPSLANELTVQGLNGQYVSPAGFAIPIKNPYITSGNGFTAYAYKGGGILHTALEANHQYKASQFGLKGSVNDVLLEATKLYYKLVLNDILLQIRVKMVEYSSGLVVVSQDLFDNGVNTQLDLYQAKYQLSADRQKLIKQQVERRKTAVNLATALNLDTDQDLTILERVMVKHRLIDQDLTVADLLRIAIDSRPSLRRYDQLRLAAKENIKVQRSALLPSVAATGTIVGSASKIISTSGSQGTSLSSSGASVGGVSGASSLPIGNTSSSSGSKEWAGRSLFIIGMDVQWNLGGMALSEAAKVQAAKSEARKATLDFNRNLERTYEEVREAYLSSITAENLINETTDAVIYAREQLRVAVVRLKDGVGTYLDVINAQRDYTAALIDKATALVDYNVAQARILHAIGRISAPTLTANAPLKQ